MTENTAEPRQLVKMRKALADTARRDLRRWAKVYAERDEIVRSSARAGVGVNEIARITGLAKTTVIRILAGDADQ